MSASLTEDTLSDYTASTPTPDSLSEGAVGLSDPKHSAGRRRMLDLVNRLHSTG